MLLHENDPKRLQRGWGGGSLCGGREEKGRDCMGRAFMVELTLYSLNKIKMYLLKLVAAKVTKALTGVNAKRKIM